MARFSRLDVLARMVGTGLVPVVSETDPAVAIRVTRALAAGGVSTVELTNRGEGAVDVFRELAAVCADELPDLALGVGSISDAGTAALYLSLGAAFVVGPVLDADTAKVCNRRKVAYSPGCGSATEIAQAEELGCEIVKVFPGDAVGGPGFVRAVRGPSPWTWLMPTGGVDVDEASLQEWFEAGVAAVGIGSKLISKDLVDAQDWDGLTDRVRQTLEIIARHNPRAGVEMPVQR